MVTLPPQDEDLVEAWVRFNAAADPRAGGSAEDVFASAENADAWADAKLTDLCIVDVDRAYAILVEILRRHSDDWVAAAIGSGPLEWVLLDGGEHIARRIAIDVSEVPNLRVALRNTSPTEMPPATADIIDQLRR